MLAGWLFYLLKGPLLNEFGKAFNNTIKSIMQEVYCVDESSPRNARNIFASGAYSAGERKKARE